MALSEGSRLGPYEILAAIGAGGMGEVYLAQDRKLMAVSVAAGPSFGIPAPLFQTHVPTGVRGNRTQYVPGRDGKRFLVNTALDSPNPPINVIVNWAAVRQP